MVRSLLECILVEWLGLISVHLPETRDNCSPAQAEASKRKRSQLAAILMLSFVEK
jgi:hypothetical protein